MPRFLILLLVLAAAVPAEEVIRALRPSELGLAANALPQPEAAWYANVAGGQAFIEGSGAERCLLVRLPALADLHGILVIYGAAGQPTQRVPFTVPAAALAATPEAGARFRTALRNWCDAQLAPVNHRHPLPEGLDRGSRAWWSLVRARAGGPAETAETDRNRRPDELDGTIDLFTGATALHENLQFDRTLRVAGDGEATVAISELPTLTVREVPWERMPGGNAQAVLDPLAERIPADQHALLFPSFDALVQGMARADGLLGGPLLAVAGHADDAGSMQRYQRQLGLEMSELAKRFGSQVIEQVAMTGSDPFLRAGTDVALILRAKQPALLAAYLGARVDALVKAGARPIQGTSIKGTNGTLSWRGAMRDDRSVSCHLLLDGDTAVVANSLVQLEAYAAVRASKRPALATAPEFPFFRRRYALGADGEMALAVISDATLRRWCSAGLRIGDSRRMRAAGLLAGLQAEWIAAGAKPDWQPAVPPPDLGAITIDAGGVRSAIYGSLTFLTPVAELAIDKATPAEAEAYRRFHDRYQRSWRDFFDPIAVRLGNGADGRLTVDLSVLPLIIGSDYRHLIEFAGNAQLQAGAGDPHRALLQVAVAVDRERGPLAEAGNDVGRTLGGLASPFGWIGSTASLYADPDPFWEDFAAQADDQQRGRFIQANLGRLPVGINVAVADPLKLAVFLTALRTMSGQAAPGLIEWGNGTYKEVPYVIISPTAQGRGMLGQVDAKLYYLAAPEGLTITLNEDLLKRVIDRIAAARTPAAEGKPTPPQPWPGTHAALGLDPAALRVLAAATGEDGLRGWMQSLTWANIAILNEWKRLFPDQDPVAVHERLWGVRPVCPGGGAYVWNADWLSMESTVFGHPDAPKDGPALPSGLERIARITAGLGFELLPTAAATAEAPAPVVEGERRYTVQRGDTLSSIARAHNTNLRALVTRNDLQTNVIRPGQVLVIPAPGAVGRAAPVPTGGASYGLRVRIEVEAR